VIFAIGFPSILRETLNNSHPNFESILIV